MIGMTIIAVLVAVIVVVQVSEPGPESTADPTTADEGAGSAANDAQATAPGAQAVAADSQGAEAEDAAAQTERSARPPVAPTAADSAVDASGAPAGQRGYDPDQPLAHDNHPYMVFADDPDPRVQSVVTALRSGEHPERIDYHVAPAPFDPAAWARDPQAYLDRVEPGRAFQVAFDPELPALSAIGASWHQVTVGETLTVAVQATPGAPVSWLSPAGGLFTETGLNALTTRADAEGVARVTWYAVPGTIDQAVVVVGSPLLRHQVHFNINVVARDEVAARRDAPDASPAATAP